MAPHTPSRSSEDFTAATKKEREETRATARVSDNTSSSKEPTVENGPLQSQASSLFPARSGPSTKSLSNEVHSLFSPGSALSFTSTSNPPQPQNTVGSQPGQYPNAGFVFGSTPPSMPGPGIFGFGRNMRQDRSDPLSWKKSDVLFAPSRSSTAPAHKGLPAPPIAPSKGLTSLVPYSSSVPMASQPSIRSVGPPAIPTTSSKEHSAFASEGSSALSKSSTGLASKNLATSTLAVPGGPCSISRLSPSHPESSDATLWGNELESTAVQRMVSRPTTSVPSSSLQTQTGDSLSIQALSRKDEVERCMYIPVENFVNLMQSAGPRFEDRKKAFLAQAELKPEDPHTRPGQFHPTPHYLKELTAHLFTSMAYFGQSPLDGLCNLVCRALPHLPYTRQEALQQGLTSLFKADTNGSGTSYASMTDRVQNIIRQGVQELELEGVSHKAWARHTEDDLFRAENRALEASQKAARASSLALEAWQPLSKVQSSVLLYADNTAVQATTQTALNASRNAITAQADAIEASKAWLRAKTEHAEAVERCAEMMRRVKALREVWHELNAALH